MAKALRTGYTTGVCAAAASRAAAILLTEDRKVDKVEVNLPNGQKAIFSVSVEKKENGAFAWVQKDAGDDPDVTNGLKIQSFVKKNQGKEIRFKAGEGVGTVHKNGLQIPPGEPAINPVPRKMIQEAVRSVTPEGLDIEISIPGGEEIAQKTFNPRLGISGGLSILGTTGIVRPFSHPAILESLKCLFRVAEAENFPFLVLSAGNIGTKAAMEILKIPREQTVEAGNYWGYLFDLIQDSKVRRIVLVGHPGKLAKLPNGDFDTHSSRSQSAVPYALSILKEALGKNLSEANTTEHIIEQLTSQELKTYANVLAVKIAEAVRKRLPYVDTDVILINMKGDFLGRAYE